MLTTGVQLGWYCSTILMLILKSGRVIGLHSWSLRRSSPLMWWRLRIWTWPPGAPAGSDPPVSRPPVYQPLEMLPGLNCVFGIGDWRIKPVRVNFVASRRWLVCSCNANIFSQWLTGFVLHIHNMLSDRPKWIHESRKIATWKLSLKWITTELFGQHCFVPWSSLNLIIMMLNVKLNIRKTASVTKTQIAIYWVHIHEVKTLFVRLTLKLNISRRR